jgi:beta-lactamase class D
VSLSAFVFTFVLINLQTGAKEVVHPELARQRVSPCSTYKIPHALIGLETGVLSGPDHLRKWDGVERARPAWNRDQTLKSAIEVSAVWYFQWLATQLGRAREAAWLAKIPYGNARVDGELTRFWLGPEGSLRISAEEQADFMRRLWRDELPFKKRNLAMVREMLPGKTGPHGDFRGKTGSWDGGLGWFVGHVRHDGGDWVFATRLDEPGADGFAARDLTERLLRERGLFIE